MKLKDLSKAQCFENSLDFNTILDVRPEFSFAEMSRNAGPAHPPWLRDSPSTNSQFSPYSIGSDKFGNSQPAIFKKENSESSSQSLPRASNSQNLVPKITNNRTLSSSLQEISEKQNLFSTLSGTSRLMEKTIL